MNHLEQLRKKVSEAEKVCARARQTFYRQEGAALDLERARLALAKAELEALAEHCDAKANDARRCKTNEHFPELPFIYQGVEETRQEAATEIRALVARVWGEEKE